MSLSNTERAPSQIHTLSVPSELGAERRAPRSSILKNKGGVSARGSPSEVIPKEKQRRTKLSFNEPVGHTIVVENWKEYNVDTANKEDELCICRIF